MGQVLLRNGNQQCEEIKKSQTFSINQKRPEGAGTVKTSNVWSTKCQTVKSKQETKEYQSKSNLLIVFSLKTKE